LSDNPLAFNDGVRTGIPWSEELWHQGFLDRFRDGVFILDAEARFAYVNQAMVERSGRPREWWLGRHPWEAVPDEHREGVQRHVRAVFAGRTPPPYEGEYRSANGETVWVELDPVPIRKGDAIVGCFGISRNTTDRKRAEEALGQAHEELERLVAARTKQLERAADQHRRTAEALAASEAQYRALFEQALDGIAVTQDDRIESVNSACLEIFGYDHPEEMVGRHIMEFIAPGSRPLAESWTEARARGEQPPSRFELQILHRNGNVRHLETSVTQFRIGDEIHGVSTHRDITGRKRAESILKRLVDAQRRAVGLVSHEARNPLTAIHGYITLLLSGNYGCLTETQSDVLRKVLRRVDRLSDLVSRFLESDRLHPRTLEQRKSSVPIAALLREVEGGYRSLASGKGLTVVREVPEEIHAYGDPDELREVFSILLSNAVRYASAGRITLRARIDGEHVAVDVEDQGPGIAEREMERLFESGYRGDEQPHELVTGAGCGLALAKEIIEDHGGEILISSELGVGSTFTVLLPTSRPKPAPDGLSGSPSPSGAPWQLYDRTTPMALTPIPRSPRAPDEPFDRPEASSTARS
jgi:PAS domain S-box-containing protein